MKIIITVLLFFLLGCSSNNKNEEISKTEISTSDEIEINEEIVQPKIDLSLLVGKTFLSGTAHQLFFRDSNNLSITFERFYDGRWSKHTIKGKFIVLSQSELKIDWNVNNTITWLNTWGDCDLQTVKQSESFSDAMSFDLTTNCFTINSVFRQSYYAGNRCGNEDKIENGDYEFCLN